jgi:uncharacterized DUF497 family protein
MRYEWNEEKNRLLKDSRDVGFEEVLLAIDEGRLLDVIPHHNLEKYPNQKLFIVRIRGYIYYVPFVEDEEKIFLKNIVPSRKYQKKYT